MRLLKYTFAISVMALAVAAKTAFGADVYVVNHSTNLSDAQVAAAMPAIQAAVDQDFMPYWNSPAVLRLDLPPPGAWVIELKDKADDPGAYGYHTIKHGAPYGQVATNDDESWTLIFTHELFEMLVDPYIDRASFIVHCTLYCHSDAFYLLEVADPVERQWYKRDGVVISDFVTDAWYSGRGGGKLDFLGLIKHHHRILAGGYAVVSYDGDWTSLDYKGQRANFFFRRSHAPSVHPRHRFS